jgi:hypothetical protein
MGGLRRGGTGMGLGKSTGAAVISCPSICPVVATNMIMRRQFVSVKASDKLQWFSYYILRNRHNKSSNWIFQFILANQDDTSDLLMTKLFFKFFNIHKPTTKERFRSKSQYLVI